MPQSLAQVVLHLVFSTKNRTPWLKDAAVRERLHAYMAGTLHKIGCEPMIVGGVEDHVHLLCGLSRTITLAGLVEEVKKSTSIWIKQQGPEFAAFYWQAGYGVFSVSISSIGEVRAYIENQEEHHRRMPFQEEFRALCRKHGLEIDERYVWD